MDNGGKTSSRVAARYLAASNAALHSAAKAVFEGLPPRLRSEVEHFLFGVMPGRAQPIEAHADELYDYYEPVRALLRGKHGRSLTLYRGEPKDKPPIKRRFLSWAASYKLAAHFARAKGYVVVEADVLVSDVAAVLVSPHNEFYVEYLVKDRPGYHEKAEPLPLVGSCVYYFSQPGEPDFDTRGFTVERAEALARRLETAVRAAGGKVLRLKIKPDDSVQASVQLPANTEVDDQDRVVLDGLWITNLQPLAV